MAEPRGRDVLRGVEAVRLRVETVPAGGLGGVTAALIEKGAAERLRAAGLRVLTGEGAPGLPVFFFRVTLFDSNCGHFLTVDMQLRETVRLARPPAGETTAATWQHAGHGMMFPRDEGRLLKGVLSFVDYFAREHTEANGR